MGMEEEKIETALAEATSFEEFAQWLGKEWPDSVYVATSMAVGNPASRSKDELDMSLIVSPDSMVSEGWLKGMCGRYPDIPEMLSDMQEDKIEYLQMATNTCTSRGRRGQNSRFVYLIPHTGKLEGANDVKKLHTAMLAWRDAIKSHGRTKVAVATPEGWDREIVRKVLEWVFRGSEINIAYLVAGSPYNTKGGSVRQQKQPKRQKNRQTEESVMVKADGRTYSELLKTVKQGIDIEKIGVEIKGIKRSDKGELILTVKGQGKAGALKSEILTNIRNVEVSTRRHETTLLVYGMDGAVTEEELKSTLCKESRVEASQIDIRIRPGRYGNQNATVVMPRDQARKLIEGGSIKVGWVPCRIKEKVPIVVCYKCLGLRHKAQECKQGIDRKDVCLNCGDQGHQAKKCENDAFCIGCQQAGHRFDQLRCPIFRKMVEETRARRAKSISKNGF